MTVGGAQPYPAYEPSRFAWVGDVPTHWEIRRIKSIFRERDERSGSPSGNLLSLTRSRGLVPHSAVSERAARAEDLSQYKVCYPGDLVMNRMQAWSGMFAIARDRGLVSPDYAVFDTIAPIEPTYFELLFRSPAMVAEFARRSKGVGSGFNRLYTPDFGAIHIAVPPRDEQVAIVRYLGQVFRTMREYVRLLEALVGPGTQTKSGLMAEYRVRLAADVVTGKLDVRAMAADLPGPPEELNTSLELEDADMPDAAASGPDIP